jgi:hypothetical protein
MLLVEVDGKSKETALTLPSHAPCFVFSNAWLCACVFLLGVWVTMLLCAQLGLKLGLECAVCDVLP